MVAVTFGGARVAAPAIAETKTGKKGKGFFARAFDAIAETRMKQAQRELALHRHLAPHDFKFDSMDWPRSKDQTPLGGW
jgi:hypothetical protein